MKVPSRWSFTQLSLVVLALLIFGVTPVKADSTTFSGSGIWGAGAPISDWSAPGATWSFSFTLPNPTPVSFFDSPQNTEFITTAISNFSYSLGGVAVNHPAADIIFFPLNQAGGFEIDFKSGMDFTNKINCAAGPGVFCSFDVFGTQFYTGSVPSITLVPGTVTTVDFDYTATTGDTLNTTGTGTFSSFTGPTGSLAVPEPATVSLVALGLLGIFAKSRKK